MKSLKSLWVIVACLFVTLAVTLWASAAQQTSTAPQVLSNAVANKPIHFDVLQPLAEIATRAPALQSDRMTHALGTSSACKIAFVIPGSGASRSAVK
jgi:hypothetical protein